MKKPIGLLVLFFLLVSTTVLAQITTTPENIDAPSISVKNETTTQGNITTSGYIPLPDENLGGVLDVMVDAFQGGNWFAVGALVVMLIVWFSGKFIRDPSLLPWIAAGTGMLLSVAASTLSGGMPWYLALLKGVTTGGNAALFWSIAGKRFLPSLVKAVEDPKPVLDQKPGPEE